MDPTKRNELIALANARSHSNAGKGGGLVQAIAQRAQGLVKACAVYEAAKLQLRYGHFKDAIELIKRTAEQTDKPALRGWALCLLAEATMMDPSFASESTRFAEVEGWLEEAQEKFEEAGDPEQIGRQLGRVEWLQGELAACQGDIEQSIELIAVGEQLRAPYASDAAEEGESRIPRFVGTRAEERATA